MRLKPVLFLILVGAAPAPAWPDDSAKLCAQIPPLAEQLTKISGMPLRHPVPCDFISKEKINEFLNKRVKEVAKPEDLRAEELTLKKFGLVPPDFDLAKNTIDLLTEQAAAFYDYDRKKLFITDTTSSETQEPVLAHEIAHAIADQNYNLAKFIKAGRKSDDGVHRPPRRHGRPGHLADVRTAGAQDGAIAQGFAGAAGHDERRQR